MNGKIISIFNNKGGTGKTTSTISIGAILNQKGYKTLLIDLDSQANLTRGLKGSMEYSVIDGLNNKSVDFDKLFKLDDDFFMLTSSDELINLDRLLDNNRIGKEKKIKAILEPLKKHFDFILLDNPPNISLTVLNSLFASDFFISPLEADFYSQVGLANIFSLADEINQERNTNLQCLGLFLTRYNAQKRMSNHLREELKNTFEDTFIDIPIRQNSKLAESSLFGESIVDFDNKSNGYLDYLKLTDCLLDRLNKYFKS